MGDGRVIRTNAIRNRQRASAISHLSWCARWEHVGACGTKLFTSSLLCFERTSPHLERMLDQVEAGRAVKPFAESASRLQPTGPTIPDASLSTSAAEGPEIWSRTPNFRWRRQASSVPGKQAISNRRAPLHRPSKLRTTTHKQFSL